MPRISGIVNNCALNPALPAMLDTICDDYAKRADGTPKNAIDQSYYDFKTCFAQYYGLDPSITFAEWFELLKTAASENFFLLQLILAPVIRLFMTRKSGVVEDVQDVGSENNEQGRYRSLNIQQAYNGFYKHFGLGIADVTRREFPDSLGNNPIEVVWDKGHFLLSPGENEKDKKEESRERRLAAQQVPGLRVAEIGYTKEGTLAQFDLIKHHIQRIFGIQIKPEASCIESALTEQDKALIENCGSSCKAHIAHHLSYYRAGFFDKRLSEIDASSDEAIAIRLQKQEIEAFLKKG